MPIRNSASRKCARPVVAEALRLAGVDEVHIGTRKPAWWCHSRRPRRIGRMIGLRADMDAPPMREENDFAWRPPHGLMHGCGHDGHITMLIGAASTRADASFRR
jgi:hippurate hydrolase